MTQRTILLSPKPLLTPRFTIQADHFNWDLADNCCQPGCEVGDGTGMCNLRWLGKSGQSGHQRRDVPRARAAETNRSMYVPARAHTTLKRAEQ